MKICAFFVTIYGPQCVNTQVICLPVQEGQRAVAVAQSLRHNIAASLCDTELQVVVADLGGI